MRTPGRIALFVLFVTASLLLSGLPASAAGKLFEGKWRLEVTIPVAPGAKERRTFTLEVDAGPRGDSLHGRMTIRDERGRAVGGVWRQVGKRVSITFELPCSEGEFCASVVMIGKIKGEGFTRIKGGTVVVMWDTPNNDNYAMYDTSNGTFTGTRIDPSESGGLKVAGGR
jgi:hypothetical protein